MDQREGREREGETVEAGWLATRKAGFSPRGAIKENNGWDG